MPNNKIDGFPMQGQATGKNLQVDVGGTKLSVSNFDVTARSTHNLSWIQGSMDFPATLGRTSQDPGKVFEAYNTPSDQFSSDSSWDDVKVKKVKLQWTTTLNDGEPAVDVTLEDCIVFFHNGICEYKSLKGTGKFKDKTILDFDGTDDSKETLVGSSFSVTAGH